MSARSLVAALAGRGLPLTELQPTGGGSVARAFFAMLDGRPVFLKTHDPPGQAPAPRRLPARAFALEAAGLAWLRATATVNVPEVVAVSGPDDDLGFLVLERVPRGGAERAPTADERFGRELAALHRVPAPLGWGEDNYLATLPQDNAAGGDSTPPLSWGRFYAERRLLPLARLAGGALSPRARRDLDRVREHIDALVGPVEPSVHLHGDLWGGNRVVSEEGVSFVIDPAVYGGHREIDLAMMQLFGGFSARVFAAYDEAHPRAPGHEERVALYQLYPLLAHVVMFGGGYAGEVEAALARSVRRLP